MGSARDASAEPATAAGSCCPARTPQRAQTPPASPPTAGICPQEPPRSRTPKAQRAQGVPPDGMAAHTQPTPGGEGKARKHTLGSFQPAPTCLQRALQTACWQMREIRECSEGRAVAAPGCRGGGRGSSSPAAAGPEPAAWSRKPTHRPSPTRPQPQAAGLSARRLCTAWSQPASALLLSPALHRKN